MEGNIDSPVFFSSQSQCIRICRVVLDGAPITALKCRSTYEDLSFEKTHVHPGRFYYSIPIYSADRWSRHRSLRSRYTIDSEDYLLIYEIPDNTKIIELTYQVVVPELGLCGPFTKSVLANL